MAEINDLKTIQKQMDECGAWAKFLIVITFVFVIASVFVEDLIGLIILLSTLTLLFHIELRYWSMKYHMIKLIKGGKNDGRKKNKSKG